MPGYCTTTLYIKQSNARARWPPQDGTHPLPAGDRADVLPAPLALFCKIFIQLFDEIRYDMPDSVTRYNSRIARYQIASIGFLYGAVKPLLCRQHPIL
jgi:hypothetical protein